jgi:hypothetical protein
MLPVRKEKSIFIVIKRHEIEDEAGDWLPRALRSKIVY